MHADRLGLDHRTEPQAAKVGKQLGNRLADMLVGVKIRPYATQIEHIISPLIGLI
ncbi:hypothetical protein Ri1_01940 [Aeromonas dhakensis]|nr:hypothetical protein Ri1_01940 [Aeromonas dhakensis]